MNKNVKEARARVPCASSPSTYVRGGEREADLVYHGLASGHTRPTGFGYRIEKSPLLPSSRHTYSSTLAPLFLRLSASFRLSLSLFLFLFSPSSVTLLVPLSPSRSLVPLAR